MSDIRLQEEALRKTSAEKHSDAAYEAGHAVANVLAYRNAHLPAVRGPAASVNTPASSARMMAEPAVFVRPQTSITRHMWPVSPNGIGATRWSGSS